MESEYRDRDITLQAEYILMGDIDGNGIVTSADVVYMKRYLVGNFIPVK